MGFEVQGKLLVKYDEAQITEKFKKREFVLEIEDGQYPQQVKFELTQDRCNALEPFDVADEMKVYFDLSGRPYDNKEGKRIYFTTLRAWRLEKTGVQSTPMKGERTTETSSSTTEDYGKYMNNDSADMDEVPF